MKDKEFLMWLHERLEQAHKENPCYDYMHKLRCIIRNTPSDKYTPNMGSCNNLEDLKRQFNDGDRNEF